MYGKNWKKIDFMLIPDALHTQIVASWPHVANLSPSAEKDTCFIWNKKHCDKVSVCESKSPDFKGKIKVRLGSHIPCHSEHYRWFLDNADHIVLVSQHNLWTILRILELQKLALPYWVHSTEKERTDDEIRPSMINIQVKDQFHSILF